MSKKEHLQNTQPAQQKTDWAGWAGE